MTPAPYDDPTGEVRRPGSAASGPSNEATRLYLITLLVGLVLLLVNVVLEQFHDLPASLKLLSELIGRDIGIACVVAVVVARIFDKAYHADMFGDPLDKAVAVVKDSTGKLLTTERKINAEFTETLAKIQLLATAGNRGLIAIHRRDTDFQEGVKNTLDRTQIRFVLVGRVFTEMLGLRKVGKGWLIDQLDKKLASTPELQLHVLLANPFDRIEQYDSDDDPFDGQSMAPYSNNAARGQMHSTMDARRHVLGLFTILHKHQKAGRIKIRFLRKYPVPYCLMLSDERVLVEPYLPSRPGGAAPCLEFDVSTDPSSAYKSYELDVDTKLFEDAEDCLVVLERFVERKLHTEVADKRESNRVEELKEARKALGIVRAWAGLPDAEPVVAGALPEPALRRRNRAVHEQNDANWDIVAYINANDVRRATLLQYSGAMVQDILLALMKKNVDVELYLQDPEWAIGERQRDRIKETLLQIENVIVTDRAQGRLTLRQYKSPASLRGILLDETFLFVGPYIFYDITGEDQTFSKDNVRIHGHDAPGLMLWAGTREYDVFASAFHRLAANLREHASGERVFVGGSPPARRPAAPVS